MDWPSMTPAVYSKEHLWSIFEQMVEEHKVSSIHLRIDVIIEQWGEKDMFIVACIHLCCCLDVNGCVLSHIQMTVNLS